MCDWTNGTRIPASRYLAQAKKRNKQLKKLRSVSRAYRKSETRGLKVLAAEAEARLQIEQLEAHERHLKAAQLQRGTMIEHAQQVSRLNSLIGPAVRFR